MLNSILLIQMEKIDILFGKFGLEGLSRQKGEQNEQTLRHFRCFFWTIGKKIPPFRRVWIWPRQLQFQVSYFFRIKASVMIIDKANIHKTPYMWLNKVLRRLFCLKIWISGGSDVHIRTTHKSWYDLIYMKSESFLFNYYTNTFGLLSLFYEFMS